MRKKKDTHSFDFRPLGLAIREAREKAGLSRNDLGDKVFYGERHIADIENIGKHPSFQLFHDLVTMFNISVDEYLKFNHCLFCNRINIFLWCRYSVPKVLFKTFLFFNVRTIYNIVDSRLYVFSIYSNHKEFFQFYKCRRFTRYSLKDASSALEI